MKKQRIITILIIIFSLISGIVSKDYFLGTIVLICGLLNSYYASIGKIYNYIFGAIFCLLSGYISLKNGLYGVAFFSFLVYVPSQIQGYISWHKNKDKNNDVKVRSFNTKNSIIITATCIIGSIVLGYLLSKVPGQKLAFLDSSSNALNLCGIILMNLRFKECWVIWLFNNTVDVIIWIINTYNNEANSIMMLLVCIGYLLINIYALIKWTKKSRKN